jgi:uncharacterized protein YpiB (UPF0302 family)
MIQFASIPVTLDKRKVICCWLFNPHQLRRGASVWVLQFVISIESDVRERRIEQAPTYLHAQCGVCPLS